MKRILALFALTALLLPAAALSQPRVHASIEVRDGQVSRFVLGLSDEYRVPARDIYVVRDEGLCDDDMREVLYIYKHSHYPLGHIARLRMRGATWEELYTWCGVARPVVVYRDGPPYGNAYGYYAHRGHDKWDREDGRHGRGHGKWDRDDDRHDRGRHNGWRDR